MVIIEKSKEQKISDIVLYTIMGIGALVLIIFLSWGYDTPYEENPDFNAPLFTDGMIILQIALIAIGAIATVCGAVHSFMVGGGKSQANDKVNIADKVSNPIAWGTCFVSLVIGVIYGVTFKDENMIINNKAWSGSDHLADSIESDICIWSIGILILGTVIAAVYSMIGSKK
ncbi:MAG: hypothetical protein K6E54_08555 [Bacteroidaceae bacterium]|jgi:hypothetical protein|nr:hypothetical protein [Bacteroidaceae bacterium]